MIKIIKQFAGFLTLSYKLKIRARKSNTQCFTVLKSAKVCQKVVKIMEKVLTLLSKLKIRARKSNTQCFTVSQMC